MYGVKYGDRIVQDPSWHCIADVIRTYHGTEYVTSDGRVTGTLVHRAAATGPWLDVA
jgi:hypothetical protein